MNRSRVKRDPALSTSAHNRGNAVSRLSSSAALDLITSYWNAQHNLAYSIAPFRQPVDPACYKKNITGNTRNLCSFGRGMTLSKGPGRAVISY
jgi:hypothetical protein